MRPFTYDRAASRTDATGKARNADAAILAGGTNLLDLMKLHVETPSRLVDVNRLDLHEVESDSDGGLRIGALVSNSTQRLASPQAIHRGTAPRASAAIRCKMTKRTMVD